MYYAITHLTLYDYSEPIVDSAMEVRMQPRSDDTQRSVRFHLDVSPDARIFSHRDYLGNMLHTFDIPAPHTQLAIKADAVVEIIGNPEIPDSLPESAWGVIDAKHEDREYYDMLLPGRFAHQTELLRQFANEIDWHRRSDPLSLLRELNTTIYEYFDYQQNVTRVDSPIDIALEKRLGVCQDFAHIMLVLARQVGIPSRYVSGYLYHRQDIGDRSDVDASHAWIEAWLPQIGWVGFDPTNNLVVTNRHIRVSIGNDYAESAPSRGVFKGGATSELDVQVKVSFLDELPIDEEENLTPDIVMPQYDYYTVQEQQQQQQQ